MHKSALMLKLKYGVTGALGLSVLQLNSRTGYEVDLTKIMWMAAGIP